MNVKTLFSVTAIVTFLYALGFILIPEQLSAIYGMVPNEASIMMARYFGAAQMGIAAILWLARSSGPSEALQAVLNGGFIIVLLELLVTLWALLFGGLGTMGWTTFVLLLFFTIWLFLVMRRGSDA